MVQREKEGRMKRNSILNSDKKPLEEKFLSSLLLSAVGDSLGWPLEFKKYKPKKRIESFIRWKKLVGGKWWGYIDEILPGEYSDDTQLTLSVARSITSNGDFDPDYFAYLELPLWLNYERGGGKSTKSAVRNLLKKRTVWFTNFYKTKEINYLNAGANGAAMRNLPIALVNIDNEERFIRDTFKNSLITHGHPRAMIGSLLIGAAQIYLIKEEPSFKMFDYIEHLLNKAYCFIKNNKTEEISTWLSVIKNKYKINFCEEFRKYTNEAKDFIQKIPDYLPKKDEEYYSFTKANTLKFKGSGISTTCVAIYLFMKYLSHPKEALINAANFVGSDTDTIASFVGSLIGSYTGTSVDMKLKELISKLQDKEYFIKIAKILWEIYSNKIESSEINRKIEKKESYLKILAWEIGLHELFWEALKEGDRVIHPVLGKGTIEHKTIRKIPKRNDYVAKIFKIKFDCGQTAYFHSRVSKEGTVSGSIAKEIEKNIKADNFFIF